MNKYLLILWVYFTGPVYIHGQHQVEVVPNASERQVDILIDGSLFTSYLYHQHLKTPVLWPIISSQGNMLTRSYPMKIKAGERVDHPHHIGIWLNYGNVNGLDFWNNSANVPAEKKQHYGTIYHRSVEGWESGQNSAWLVTTADWKSPDQQVLLSERSRHEFSTEDGYVIIDRTTTLTAMVSKVKFADDKEGMFAIRVARELELPSHGPALLMGADGNAVETEEVDNTQVTGEYLSATGVEGQSVWGTRSRWMKLHGKINGEQVALVIIDHPSNVGYPTYWHARGYGLFSANTLGQKIFSDGQEELNFQLTKGDSVTFQYRLVVASGALSNDKIVSLADQFARK